MEICLINLQSKNLTQEQNDALNKCLGVKNINFITDNYYEGNNIYNNVYDAILNFGKIYPKQMFCFTVEGENPEDYYIIAVKGKDFEVRGIIIPETTDLDLWNKNKQDQ